MNEDIDELLKLDGFSLMWFFLLMLFLPSLFLSPSLPLLSFTIPHFLHLSLSPFLSLTPQTSSQTYLRPSPWWRSSSRSHPTPHEKTGVRGRGYCREPWEVECSCFDDCRVFWIWSIRGTYVLTVRHLSVFSFYTLFFYYCLHFYFIFYFYVIFSVFFTFIFSYLIYFFILLYFIFAFPGVSRGCHGSDQGTWTGGIIISESGRCESIRGKGTEIGGFWWWYMIRKYEKIN